MKEEENIGSQKQDTQLREDEGPPLDDGEGSSQGDNCTSSLKSRLGQCDSEACMLLSFLPKNVWVSLALSLSIHGFLGSCTDEVLSLLFLFGSADDTRFTSIYVLLGLVPKSWRSAKVILEITIFHSSVCGPHYALASVPVVVR